MQNLDEKIDSFLYESLLKEYVKASDFRATYSKIAQIQGAQEKQMYGLDKELAKEFIGLIRLLVVCEQHGSPPWTVSIRGKEFLPDLILALPKPDETIKKVKQFLGWDESTNKYTPRDPSDPASAINDIQKFVRGEAPLDIPDGKIDIDFKKLIIDRWEDREESFKNRILELMKVVTRYIHEKMPDPEGKPLTPGSGAAAGGVKILPSKLSDGKTNYLYIRVVNFLNKNQTEVDKEVARKLKEYNAYLERTRENYRNLNKQNTPGNADREYGYYGPGPNDGATKKSWDKFVVFLKELDAIGNQANSDYDPSFAAVRPLPENLIKEDKLNKIVINFAELRKKELNESFLAMFGGWVEHILNSMFGGGVLSAEIQGSRREVESFAKTIAGEKHYIEAARRYGLDHPTTYRSRSKLDVAVRNFERDTGLKWPFK